MSIDGGTGARKWSGRDRRAGPSSRLCRGVGGRGTGRRRRRTREIAAELGAWRERGHLPHRGHRSRECRNTNVGHSVGWDGSGAPWQPTGGRAGAPKDVVIPTASPTLSTDRGRAAASRTAIAARPTTVRRYPIKHLPTGLRPCSPSGLNKGWGNPIRQPARPGRYRAGTISLVKGIGLEAPSFPIPSRQDAAHGLMREALRMGPAGPVPETAIGSVLSGGVLLGQAGPQVCRRRHR